MGGMKAKPTGGGEATRVTAMATGTGDEARGAGDTWYSEPLLPQRREGPCSAAF